MNRLVQTLLRGLLLGVWVAIAVPAWAHKASDSYVVLQVKGAAVQGQWDIALRDIDFAIGLEDRKSVV